MAITLDLQQSNIGIPVSDAYFRICTSQINRTLDPSNRFIAVIDVFGYATPPSDSNDFNSVAFFRFHAPLPEIDAQADITFLGKCYSWVASRPEMAGCIAA